MMTCSCSTCTEPVEVSTDNVPPAVLSNTDTVIAIVCGVVSVVVILAVAAIVIAALKFALKIYRQKSFNLNTR